MAYTTVTSTSYGGRMKKALKSVALGFLMLIGGTILLWWNEGRTVKTTRMLKEAQGVCVELGDIDQIHPEMDGKMVHASGFANTEDVLTDPLFDIKLTAIKLIRDAEYYQWVEEKKTETRDKVGGGQETITTYTYHKEWVDEPVSSAGFEDPEYRNIDNDVLMEVSDYTQIAKNVSFGAYSLPRDLVSQMSDEQPLELDIHPAILNYCEKELHDTYEVEDSDTFMHQKGNVLYIGINPSRPMVGDVRVTFEKVLPGDVSILAKVNGSTFEKYTAKNGYSMMPLEDGLVSMDTMFANQHAENQETAWILRLIGFIMVVWGFMNIFKLISQLLMLLPFLGNIAELGAFLVSLVLGLVWSLVIIAVAWIFYRPLLAILLLAAAGGLIWFLSKRSKAKEAEYATVEAESSEDLTKTQQ